MLSEDDIFEKFPEATKLYDMHALGCHPDYRGRGIATELIHQGFQVRKICSFNLFQIINNDFFGNFFSRFQVTIIQSWNGIA
jgi:hypothetical protein